MTLNDFGVKRMESNKSAETDPRSGLSPQQHTKGEAPLSEKPSLFLIVSTIIGVSILLLVIVYFNRGLPIAS